MLMVTVQACCGCDLRNAVIDYCLRLIDYGYQTIFWMNTSWTFLLFEFVLLQTYSSVNVLSYLVDRNGRYDYKNFSLRVTPP